MLAKHLGLSRLEIVKWTGALALAVCVLPGSRPAASEGDDGPGGKPPAQTEIEPGPAAKPATLDSLIEAGKVRYPGAYQAARAARELAESPSRSQP